jgi:plastocyanin
MLRALPAVVSALVFAPAASGATTDVNANGNIFTGGLSFTPATISVAVGDTVRWKNTDFLVPHTATEDHGLWDLAGSYGATPANPPGFGPGTTVQRVFEAGTAAYYCRVHPTQMRGVIAVPVTLGLAQRRVLVRGAHKARIVRYVRATWAVTAPAAGEVFDVEVRRGLGQWRDARTGTTETNALIRAGRRGTTTHVRARLRRADNAAAATGWSPDAQITAP